MVRTVTRSIRSRAVCFLVDCCFRSKLFAKFGKLARVASVGCVSVCVSSLASPLSSSSFKSPLASSLLFVVNRFASISSHVVCQSRIQSVSVS